MIFDSGMKVKEHFLAWLWNKWLSRILTLSVGVQQKYLVVTCNYEARKLGIKKLMSVRDAKEKCPQLILVNGEDLTPYREISYKVTGTNQQVFNKVE